MREEPGAYDRKQAALCRAAAELAKQEGDLAHADQLEVSALAYEKDALSAVRSAREKRAGAKPYSYSW